MLFNNGCHSGSNSCHALYCVFMCSIINPSNNIPRCLLSVPLLPRVSVLFPLLQCLLTFLSSLPLLWSFPPPQKTVYFKSLLVNPRNLTFLESGEVGIISLIWINQSNSLICILDLLYKNNLYYMKIHFSLQNLRTIKLNSSLILSFLFISFQTFSHMYRMEILIFQ